MISPIGMMPGGMYGMYGMNGMNSMSGMNSSGGNVHQSFKSMYGVGYEDSGATRPYAQPYPMAITPRAPEPPEAKTWLGRFLRKCFG